MIVRTGCECVNVGVDGLEDLFSEFVWKKSKKGLILIINHNLASSAFDQFKTWNSSKSRLCSSIPSLGRTLVVFSTFRSLKVTCNIPILPKGIGIQVNTWNNWLGFYTCKCFTIYIYYDVMMTSSVFRQNFPNIPKILQVCEHVFADVGFFGLVLEVLIQLGKELWFLSEE